jgi:hypothetical protein
MTGCSPQQASSAMTMPGWAASAGRRAPRARCRRGTARGRRWHVLSLLHRHSGDEKPLGTKPSRLTRPDSGRSGSFNEVGKSLARRAVGDTGRMVDNTARDRAIYHALKAADEVAAALQAHLIEEHQADPDRTAAQNPSTNSLKLLRQARERLGQGLRSIEAEVIAESDKISLRNP